ncbi:HD domain-containing phosphohydrolase [Candidatus Omnitrophota bacterium]
MGINYQLAPFLIFLICSSIGIFALRKGKISEVNLFFGLLNIATAIWAIAIFFFMISKVSDARLFWIRFSHIGLSFIPGLYLLFILSLISLKEVEKRYIGLVVLGALFFSILTLNSGFFTSISIKRHSAHWGRPGLFYPAFIIYFFNVFFYAYYLLIKYCRESRDNSKQFRNIIIASPIGFIGFASVFCTTYNICVPFIYPYGLYLVLVFDVVIIYAILRYRLMGVEIIIRETAVLAGIFGFSIGIFVLAMMLGQQILTPYIGENDWLVPSMALLIVTFAVRPIERFIFATLGKSIFRRRHEYQKVLEDAAAGMATIHNPKQLLQMIVHMVVMKMKLDNVSIIIYDEKFKEYRLRASRGKKSPKSGGFIFKDSDPFIEWLREKKEPLLFSDIVGWAKEKKGESVKGMLTSDLIQVKEHMEVLNANVCIPSFYREQLLGILVLGRKISNDLFTHDDFNFFKALADEAAIAIKNSQLYAELEDRANEIETLYTREHRLFLHASVAFAAAIDARDPYTHGHSERVTNYSLAILKNFGPMPEVQQTPAFRQKLQIAAVLHDIGKIGIPDDVLHKPSKLDKEEQREMEKHPVIGGEIIFHIKGLRDIVSAIRHHHERYDGKGYPEGLAKSDVPFMSRIIAVADTYDAMTSDRPYRKGLRDEVAKDEIRNNSGSQFDPYVVAAFLRTFEAGEIKRRSKDSVKVGYDE